MKAIIIEDEHLAFLELKRMLSEVYPNVEIVSHLSSVDEINQQIDYVEADLIFCDINLPDGNSIDALHGVKKNLPIIFTTAHEKYAVQSFRHDSVDYLLKPFSNLELKDAIDKLKNRNTPTSMDLFQLKEILSTANTGRKSTRQRILIKSGDKYSYISLEDIAYFYAEDKLTFVKTKAGKKHIVDETLNEIETTLNQRFFRISRKMICSIESIVSASKHFNSRLTLSLVPPMEDTILVSRARVQDFLAWMNK